MIRTTRRQGAVLLIVLVLLSLFAVIGLTFVLYSQAEATNARIQRETMVSVSDLPDPAAAMHSFLNQLIYPVPEAGPSIASALRGHELARTIYGYNPASRNITPYSGIGGFNEQVAYTLSAIQNSTNNPTTLGSGNIDRRNVINYTGQFSTDTVLDPERNLSRTAANVFTGTPNPASNYIGKNAPYTYPDRNNAFLGMMDPATGRIVMPSFHRPQLFLQGQSVITNPDQNLAFNNPNWTNAEGRYKILRPRPFDHQFDSGDGRGLVSDFPLPPANPDGSVTGDVQNWRWTNGEQRNDSVWLHANLPPAKFRGRDVQPLVAALVLPLDGRVNLNLAGNYRTDLNTHASRDGFGPWEINPARVLIDQIAEPVNPPPNPPQQPNPAPVPLLTTEVQALVHYRYGNAYRPLSAPWMSQVNFAALDPTLVTPLPTPASTAIPDYSPVNFDPHPGTAFNYQTTLLRTEPNFPATGGWDNNAVVQRHPSLFNPYFCNAVTLGGGRLMRLFDLRQTAYRYSGKDSYAPPLFGLLSPNSSLSGASPNHPSNRVRANITSISNSLVRSGLSPNFSQLTATNFTLPPPPVGALVAPTPVAASQTFTASTIPAPDSDAIDGYRALAARLGPIDLNRPLEDYRQDRNVPMDNFANLQPTALSTRVPLADADRQAFAKDIFDRLVIATGAPYVPDPATGRPLNFSNVPVNSPAYHGLRYLAQLAANIVDYIDNDDVCTRFVWNPGGPPNDQAVFGVEKPRLVLNEVYSEITNHPNDVNSNEANNDFQVRFFFEVLNPLNHPLKVGSSPNLRAGPNPMLSHFTGDGRASLVINGQSVYQLQVFNESDSVINQLYGPNSYANVTGAASAPRFTTTIPASYSLPLPLPPGSSATSYSDNVAGGAVRYSQVGPNDGQPQDIGFRFIFPEQATDGTNSDAVTFAPPETSRSIRIPQTGGSVAHYNQPAVRRDEIPRLLATMNRGTQGRHSVLLRRLANPYLPHNPVTNPYITVDGMHDIFVNNAIRVGQRQQPTVPNSGIVVPPPNPADNATRSRSRRAPMYAYRGTSEQASYAANQQRSSMAHNPNRLGEFEWLPHLDRKVVNPLELLHVSACKPHEVLHFFVTSRSAQTDPVVQPQQKHHHTAPWLTSQANLHRALEMLTVKPWMYGVPVGGRVPGRVNVNAIWHPHVLAALLDPQASNTFTQAEVMNLWTNLFAGGPMARTKAAVPVQTGLPTPVPVFIPGTTVEEGDPNGDRPIKSFGAGVFAPGGSMIAPSGLSDTLFRTNPAVPNSPPLIWNTTPTHPYPQAEMLRKLMNNITTTSDTFVVFFTIGYFEIRSPATATRYMPVLGREVFNEVPGDLRVQYAAIIDRSMLAVNPDPTVPAQPPNVFFSELTAPCDTAATNVINIFMRTTAGSNQNLQVEYEGQRVVIRNVPTANLQPNEVNRIVIGTGSEAIYFDIPPQATFTPPSGGGITQPGQISIQANFFQPRSVLTGAIVPPAQRRKYYAGEPVSSVVLGNPGPQPNFDPNAPAYRQVIRDLIQLR